MNTDCKVRAVEHLTRFGFVHVPEQDRALEQTNGVVYESWIHPEHKLECLLAPKDDYKYRDYAVDALFLQSVDTDGIKPLFRRKRLCHYDFNCNGFDLSELVKDMNSYVEYEQFKRDNIDVSNVLIYYPSGNASRRGLSQVYPAYITEGDLLRGLGELLNYRADIMARLDEAEKNMRKLLKEHIDKQPV